VTPNQAERALVRVRQRMNANERQKATLYLEAQAAIIAAKDEAGLSYERIRELLEVPLSTVHYWRAGPQSWKAERERRKAKAGR